MIETGVELQLASDVTGVQLQNTFRESAAIRVSWCWPGDNGNRGRDEAPSEDHRVCKEWERLWCSFTEAA